MFAKIECLGTIYLYNLYMYHFERMFRDLVKFHRDFTRPIWAPKWIRMVVNSKGNPVIAGKSRLVKYP